MNLEHFPQEKETSVQFGSSTAYGNSRILQIGNVEKLYNSSGNGTIQSDSGQQFSNISLQRVARYVRRPSLESRLKEELHDRLDLPCARSKVVVIQGFGGAGKTQLMLQYAQEYHRDYFGVFWLQLSDKESVEREISVIYRWMFPSRNSQSTTPVQFKEMCVHINSWFRGRTEKWLWLIDNADDVRNSKDENCLDLMTIIPQPPCVDVIITTRNKAVSDITPLEALEVKDMEKEEALELFRSMSKMDPTTATSKMIETADEIVEDLGCFPLAVSLAGASVSQLPYLSAEDLQAYLQDLRLSRKDLLNQQPKHLMMQYSETILASWETSYRRLKQQSVLAAKLLSFIALFDRNDIFLELFEVALDGKNITKQFFKNGWQDVLLSWRQPLSMSDIRIACGHLRSFSLINRATGLHCFTMHKLVQAWAFERLDVASKSKVAHAVCIFFDAIINNVRIPETKSRISKHIMANFSIVSAAILKSNFKKNTVLEILEYWKCYSSLTTGVGLFNASHQIQSFQADQLLNLKGPCHRQTLEAMSTLGATLSSLGRFEEDASMIEIVLERSKQTLGENHPDTLKNMNNLAVTLSSLGRFEEAASMHNEVLEKRKQTLGEDHEDVYTSMRDLACALNRLECHEEAAAMLEVVVEKYKQILGENHSKTLFSMGHLGESLMYLGRQNEAESMLRKVVEMSKQTQGQTHPTTLIYVHKLGQVLTTRGSLSEASSLVSFALDEGKHVFGETHIYTFFFRQSFAIIKFQEGELKEAGVLMEKLLEDVKQAFGEKHRVAVSASNWVAKIHKRSIEEGNR